MLEVPLLESLRHALETLALRKGGLTGQLGFRKEGLEGQERID